MSGLPPNLLLRNASVPSIGRVYSHDSRPSANMFFARSFSLRVSPVNDASASTVIDVNPTACT